MELYRKQFATLTNGNTREMVAKAVRHSSTGSNKLRSVHISPVTIEKAEQGVTFQITSAGDSAIRLTFERAYSANQTKAMKSEIRKLARAKLESATIDFMTTEGTAFINALASLATLE